MDRLRLSRLTLPHSEQVVDIPFHEALTVIYGASETGKSYVGELIDYTLGASFVRLLPEGEGYDDVLLTLEANSSDYLTLGRSLSNSRRQVLYEGMASTTVNDLTAITIRGSGPNSLSARLLPRLGLEGVTLRANQNNRRQALSIRDVARLCIVDEVKMQSDSSPALSGQFVSQTANKAALDVVLGIEDQTAKQATRDSDAPVRSRAQVELIDDLIARLTDKVGTDDLVGLRSQRERLNATVEDLDRNLQPVHSQRDLLSRELTQAHEFLRDASLELREARDLFSRFELLSLQYTSDDERLGMVDEVGDLLGFFTPGVCVFCGAEPEHQQNFAEHVREEVTALGEAVENERGKLRALKADLDVTIVDLRSRINELEVRREEIRSSRRSMTEQLAGLDAQLRPGSARVRELTDARSRVDLALENANEVQRLIDLRAKLDAEPPTPPRPTQTSLTPLHDEFAKTIGTLLSEWGIARQGSDVRLDPRSYDLILDGRPRGTRGKGMRAVLHAAYTLALADYCIERELPHPGFVVLDSPLITYRGPLGGANEDEAIDASVVERFYDSILRRGWCQVVVLENTDPPDLKPDAGELIEFSGNDFSATRFGLYPRKLR